MPREILIQILNEKLVFNFIIILIVYFGLNWVIFKLSFQILGIKIRFLQILPGIILAMFYNLSGKQIFPNNLIYVLVSILILVIMIKVIGGDAVSWIRSFWAIFLVIFSTGIGVLIIQTPISLQPAIARFITKTPAGVVVGTIMESIFPLIASFLLKTIDISIIPPVKRKIKIIDYANLYLFAGMFSFLYTASARTLRNLDIYSKIDLIKDMLYEWFIASTLIIVYYFVYTNTRKQREIDRQKHENELQINQAKIAALNEQISELKKIVEYLSNLKVKPQKLINDITNAINNVTIVVNQLKDYSDVMEKSDYIIINPNDLTKYNLKTNEKLVLEEILADTDKTFQEIGDTIHLAEGTVKNIASELYKKFEVKNKDELKNYFIKQALNNKD